MKSLGLLECKGYAPAYAAADAMLKAADTQIVKRVSVGGGFVAIVVEGEIGAVRTAVDAGAICAKNMGALLGCMTIARPTDDLVALITNQ